MTEKYEKALDPVFKPIIEAAWKAMFLTPDPIANEMLARKKTFEKFLKVVEAEMRPIPTGRELWGMKIYVDETAPEGKIRFKLRGVTVAEVYAFEPKEKNQ